MYDAPIFNLNDPFLKHALLTFDDPERAQDMSVRDLFAHWEMTGESKSVSLRCGRCKGWGYRKPQLSTQKIFFRCPCGQGNTLICPPLSHEIKANITYPTVNGQPCTAAQLREIAEKGHRGFWARLTRIQYRDIPKGYPQPMLALWPWVVPSIQGWSTNPSPAYRIIRLIAERFATQPPVIQWVTKELAEAVVQSPLPQHHLADVPLRWHYAAFMLPPGVLEWQRGKHIEMLSYAAIPQGHQVLAKETVLFAAAPKILIWARTSEGSDITATCTRIGHLGKATIKCDQTTPFDHRQVFAKLFGVALHLAEVAALQPSVVGKSKTLFGKNKKSPRVAKTAPILGASRSPSCKGSNSNDGDQHLESKWVGAHSQGYRVGPKGQRIETRHKAPYLSPAPKQEVPL